MLRKIPFLEFSIEEIRMYSRDLVWKRINWKYWNLVFVENYKSESLEFDVLNLVWQVVR